MSNYTTDIVKQMINAGIKTKPADCPQEIWDEANVVEAQFEEVKEEPVAQGETSTAVATVSSFEQYPSSYSFADFGSTTLPIKVDAMLKNKSGSLLINGKEILKMPFLAKVLLAESKMKRTIKCNLNGNIQYFSTYGGGKATNGMDWKTVVAECKARDASAYEYDSFDFCFELNEDLKGTDGKVVATKGQRIGYTTSSTNKAEILAFQKQCIEKGLDLNKAEVNAKVSFKLKSNTLNQNWNVIAIEAL